LPQHMDGSIVFAMWRQCAPPSDTWFPGSIRVDNPNDISIGSAVSAGRTIVTDRQTDRPRYSVCNNRPQLRTWYCDAAYKQNRWAEIRSSPGRWRQSWWKN